MWTMDWGNAEALSQIVGIYDGAGLDVTFVPRQIELALGNLTPGSTGARLRAESDEDADFVWMGQSAAITTASSSLTTIILSGYMVQVIMAETQERLAVHAKTAGFPFGDGWIPIASFAGVEEDPFYFAIPIVLKKSFSVDFIAFNGGNAQRQIFLTLHGYSALTTQKARKTDRIAA